MSRRNSRQSGRAASKAWSMDPWETDENGKFASRMPMLSPIAVLGIIPIFGTFFSAMMIFSGYHLDGWDVGTSQQAIRDGQVGLAVQLLWIAVTLLVFVGI